MLYFRFYDDNWYVAHQPIDEIELVVVEAIPGNEQITRVNWRRTTLFSEVFLGIFLRERESEPPPRDLLSASNVGSLALSRRKISRKNLWAQISGESIRR